MPTTTAPTLPKLENVVRWPAYRSGRMETWGGTVGRDWVARRVEMPGTPWIVTYLPTGQESCHSNQHRSRRYIGRPNILELLLDRALTDLRREPDSRNHQRAVRHLTGTMVMPDPLLPAEAVCTCGGMLVCIDRLWRHLDVCRWCETTGTRCDDAVQTHHAGCDHPTPAPCSHANCHAANDLMAVPCLSGHTLCSGCCHGEC